jgi:hypothetical protein
MTETQEPTLGDGEFSPRLLSDEQQQLWIDEHNPHLRGTYEWNMWTASFYFDQMTAVSDPRRSRGARARQVLLWVQVCCAAIAVIMIVVVMVTHG